jgi:hypothetical protein
MLFLETQARGYGLPWQATTERHGCGTAIGGMRVSKYGRINSNHLFR